jgi:membrane associated rhomboid family serine protease
MIMIPIGDDNTGRIRPPLVNYALIAANVLVFVFLQGMGENERFTYAFSTVPEEIRTGKDLASDVIIEDPETGRRVEVLRLEPTPISVYLTLLTSMFMHGGIAHLLGNMLFLWIFGDNLEDRLGHVRYLIFYLLTGVLAAAAHVVTTFVTGGNPYIPCLGASGAISGVLGGYLLLFPKRRVRVILLQIITTVPAIVAIGLWFVFQVLSGLGSLSAQGGGVAYAAHVGGFIAGLVLIPVFALGTKRGPYQGYS